MTATLERTQDGSLLRTNHQVVVDLDGCILSMADFAAELDDKPDRWARFFSHTPDAEPVPEGVELIESLHRCGWQYSISTTRPHAVRAGKVYVRQLAPILAWAKANLPAQPRWCYMRAASQTATTPADVKLGHFLATAAPPRTGMKSISAIMHVDDELTAIDQLIDHQIPALHVTDLVGTPDSDLQDLLAYGAGAAKHLHHEHACGNLNGAHCPLT